MKCYHCGSLILGEPVCDQEFHQDGEYCSKQCLIAEMKMIEAWESDSGE